MHINGYAESGQRFSKHYPMFPSQLAGYHLLEVNDETADSKLDEESGNLGLEIQFGHHDHG